MSAPPFKVVQIDGSGALKSPSGKAFDQSFGFDFLNSMYKKDHICRGLVDGEMAFVESFTQPLVVHEVEKVDQNKIRLFFNYGYAEEFDFSKKLMMDDWSRLCGESEKEVPFVFGAEAQKKFLEKMCSSYDLDEFTYEDKKYEVLDWYIEKAESLDSNFWTDSYKKDHMPWDLNRSHPCLEWTLPRLKLFKSKVLVPGCGRGHDVKKLKSLGHNVTGLDFSPEAVTRARELYPDLDFVEDDFFEFSKKNEGSFDLVFEHTLFCALSPSAREKLVKAWHRILMPGGHLMGTFVVAHKRTGPPFGITEWELENILEKRFKIEYWGRLRGSESARPGKELFVYAQRREA